MILGPWRPWIITFLRRVIPALGQARVRPTSWWRSPSGNAAVGGNRESQHLFALALDVTGPDIELARFDWAARRTGLVSVRENDHVHVQLFPGGALARAGVEFPTRA